MGLVPVGGTLEKFGFVCGGGVMDGVGASRCNSREVLGYVWTPEESDIEVHEGQLRYSTECLKAALRNYLGMNYVSL